MKRDEPHITICCDNSANVHSCNRATIPLSELGVTLDQWNKLDEQGKYLLVKGWVNEMGWIEIWWEEDKR